LELQIKLRKNLASLLLRILEPLGPGQYIDTFFAHRPYPSAAKDVEVVELKIAPLVEISTLTRPDPDRSTVDQLIFESSTLYIYPDVDLRAPLAGRPVCKPGSRQLLLANLWPTDLCLLRQGGRVCAAEEIVERTRMTGTMPGGNGQRRRRGMQSTKG
jgi:hypothetical protein